MREIPGSIPGAACPLEGEGRSSHYQHVAHVAPSDNCCTPAGNLVLNAVVCFLQLPTGAIHLPSQENGDGVILKNAATHMCVSVLAAVRVNVLEQNRVS